MKVRSIKRRYFTHLAMRWHLAVRNVAPAALVTKFKVYRKKDDVEVGEFLVADEADAVVAKAKAAKKASLYVKQVTVAA